MVNNDESMDNIWLIWIIYDESMDVDDDHEYFWFGFK